MDTQYMLDRNYITLKQSRIVAHDEFEGGLCYTLRQSINCFRKDNFFY
jgi:hypothetical protein